MAVSNETSITIGGIYYTHYLVTPIKWANLLDERLDEAYISLRYVRKKSFPRLTPVELTINNKWYYGHLKNPTFQDVKTQKLRFIIANDEVTEVPNGSGCYNHDLYLIEETKLLEMYIVDSLTFTNVLGRNFPTNPVNSDMLQSNPDPKEVNYQYLFKPCLRTKEYYKTPLETNSEFKFIPVTELDPRWQEPDISTIPNNYNPRLCKMQVLYNNQEIFSGTGENVTYSTKLLVGFYQVIYDVYCTPDLGTESKVQLKFAFYVGANKLPLKRLTCTDVITRLLDLAEPLLMGEKPQFVFNAEQAELFEKNYAPQMTMTKQTLRECLQQVGKIVHGEPRLRVIDGVKEIYFDMYGGTKKSNIKGKPHSELTVSARIDNYCTSIDSSAQNLVSQLDYAQGVITEPYSDGYRTVRTETQYVRISDTNMMISTDRPLHSVIQVKCGIVPQNEDIRYVDITDYIFESTVYNSQLSSYIAAFPYSKAYGLYYTQGEKNIKGLNFKADDDHVMFPAFAKYAIYNILEKASGKSINDLLPNDNEYPLLAFQVTYLPFFDVRVGQTKSNYKDNPTKATLAYNQQANVIESAYYGENLKGTIARLGNLEMSKTYLMAWIHSIPKAGDMYDNEYYISAVSVEMYPTCFVCTIGLSKDFNRLSQYIGISSVKRYYEVSERQAYDRDTLYQEYVVIGDRIERDPSSLIGFSAMFGIYDSFAQSGVMKPVTRAVAWGGTYQNPTYNITDGKRVPALPCAQFPVVSVAMGNSILFIWNYQDNYSAGSTSTYVESNTINQDATVVTKGYFQDDYQYTDYYGRMYYYNFDLQTSGEVASDFEEQTKIGLALPQADLPISSSDIVSTMLSSPYVYRKDNREIPQINFQIEFVTNRDNLIIGSALASVCPLIRKSDPALAAKLYLLDEPLNKFTSHIEGKLNMDLSTQTSIGFSYGGLTAESKQFYLSSEAFTKDCKSWVFATGQTKYTETVEDEAGNQSEQVYYKGGDVILASNGDFEAGDNIGQIWFTPKRNLYMDFYKVKFSDEYYEIPIKSATEIDSEDQGE